MKNKAIRTLAGALGLFFSAGGMWAGEVTVGKRYVLEDAGQVRSLVVSGQGMAVRPAGGSLRVKNFPKAVDAAGLRERMRQERVAQPNVSEINFLLDEPAVRGTSGKTAPPLILTCQVHVTLQEGATPEAVAQAVGVARVDQPSYAPGQYIFHATDQGGALELMERLRKLPGVKSANAMLARSLRKRFTPNDPFYTYALANPGYQWHLKNSGQRAGVTGVDLNVETAWNTRKGTGVTLGILDDGVEVTHPDLAANYLASASWDFRDNDNDPAPVDTEDNHGTAVAGLAVAVGNNGAGVSGVAPSAKLAAIRIDLNTIPDSQVADALAYKNDVIQIKSNSYGPPDYGYTLEGIGPLTEAALLDGATNGRAGRGTIFVVAGGNGAAEGDNSNYDAFANSIYTIAVGAASDDGTPTYFGEPGANLVVCGLGDNEDDQSITTTDRTGADGYNDGTGSNFADAAYTNDFGGTSGCAPQVAGVVALLLEAKSTLGWRDVQEILISSATKNHATDADWMTNTAGYSFNHKYGAGVANATAALTKANTWTNLGTQTSATLTNAALNLAVPDYPSTVGATTSFNFATQPVLRVEHVTVELNVTHPARGELDVILTSPSGMTSRLAERRDDLTANFNWTFMTVRHWGENSSGTWKLSIIDREKQTTGTLVSATVKIYGTAATAPAAAPTVTSAGTATAMVGVPFSYQITATNAPTSYTVTGLPVSLTVNTTTGLITGTPTATTAINATLKASNGSGLGAGRALAITVSATAGLATGLDNLRTNWVTGGSATWALNTTAGNAHDGIDSAKSANVPANATDGSWSYLKTWVEGPAILRFWWKANTLDAADTLYFYWDGGDPANYIYGANTPYTEDYYYLPAGRHSIRWELYRGYDTTTAGANSTGWVDQVTLTDPNASAPYILRQPINAYAPEGGKTCFSLYAVGQANLSYQWKRGAANVSVNGTSKDLLIQPVPAGSATYTCVISNGVGTTTSTAVNLTVTPTGTAATLANGLDASILGFGTSASLGWARQTSVTNDGVDALKSGAIGNGGTSVLQTCVTGPATVTFWWKVSSELDYDTLDLLLDGGFQDSISGEADWAQTSVEIPLGLHLLEWRYTKDSQDLAGSDAGYLDQITLTPNGFPAWQTVQFSPAQQSAASITGRQDDPDKDGFSNLLEYGLGMNPNLNSRTGLPVSTRQGNNLEFTYVDDWDHLDVALIPEVSSALDSAWTEATPTEVSVSGSLHTMKVTIPLGVGKSFVRLRVQEL